MGRQALLIVVCCSGTWKFMKGVSCVFTSQRHLDCDVCPNAEDFPKGVIDQRSKACVCLSVRVCSCTSKHVPRDCPQTPRGTIHAQFPKLRQTQSVSLGMYLGFGRERNGILPLSFLSPAEIIGWCRSDALSKNTFAVVAKPKTRDTVWRSECAWRCRLWVCPIDASVNVVWAGVWSCGSSGHGGIDSGLLERDWRLDALSLWQRLLAVAPPNRGLLHFVRRFALPESGRGSCAGRWLPLSKCVQWPPLLLVTN